MRLEVADQVPYRAVWQLPVMAHVLGCLLEFFHFGVGGDRDLRHIRLR